MTPRRRTGSGHPIALDLEATGLDPRHDVILSFGAVPIVDGRVRLDRSTYRVMQSNQPVPAEVVRIHRLRPVDLALASPRSEALAELESIVGDHPLVVWSAWVETSFLAAAFGGRRRTWERRMIDVRDLVQATDARLARQWESHETLAMAARRFAVPPEAAHHALADAFVTAQLFLVTSALLGRHVPAPTRSGAARPPRRTRSRPPPGADGVDTVPA
ncbi:MAG TPA: 3'-5' exonuclease [Acidimicrobiia bacterium]|nr:3'-5' exonuclease [Acidimicrobiia bacterium]